MFLFFFYQADAGGCAGLAASGLLVLREVVPAHLTWQFATADERDAVTGLCLQWLQRAPQHAPPADDAAAAAATFSLQVASGFPNSWVATPT